MHSFNEYVFDKHYIPSTMQGNREIGENKIHQDHGPRKDSCAREDRQLLHVGQSRGITKEGHLIQTWGRQQRLLGE